AVAPALDKLLAHDAHEAGAGDELGTVRFECGIKRCLECAAVSKLLVVDNISGDARLFGALKCGRIWLVGDDARDLGWIVGCARGRDQRRHVGPAPRDENAYASLRCRHGGRLSQAPSLVSTGSILFRYLSDWRPA